MTWLRIVLSSSRCAPFIQSMVSIRKIRKIAIFWNDYVWSTSLSSLTLKDPGLLPNERTRGGGGGGGSPQLSQLVVDRNGWFFQGRNILLKYEFFEKRSKHFGFNCLNYWVPPKIGIFQAKIVLALISIFFVPPRTIRQSPGSPVIFVD